MAAAGINELLFHQAEKYIPGGVNSPVRSFRAVGGTPIFIRRGRGALIYGEDGRAYIDYCACWGALILGHAPSRVIRALRRTLARGTGFGTVTRQETELARAICEAIPSIERIRLTSSGTEAVMSAIRLARAVTGRDTIIKFEGAYHGHADSMLVRAGSGSSTLGVPDSPGVPEAFARHTVVVPYNDLKSVSEVMKKRGGEIAAIIVEPVAGNMGVVGPGSGFLAGLRRLCDRHRAVLIFDEVITGFRVSYGGAQELFGVRPDLTCLGKIIGGGLPIGGYGGKRDLMDWIAPLGGVYQAGTLAGNPLSVQAGLTTLSILREEQPYESMALKAEQLCRGVARSAAKQDIGVTVNRVGSMFSFFFTDREVNDRAAAYSQNGEAYRRFFHSLLESGVYLSPSGFESNFISTVHRDQDVEKTLKAIERTFQVWRKE